MKLAGGTIARRGGLQNKSRITGQPVRSFAGVVMGNMVQVQFPQASPDAVLERLCEALSSSFLETARMIRRL